MSDDRYAEWDAAYVLGALSSADRLEFEAHLAGCAACSARVADLAGLPGVLAHLDARSAEALRELPATTADSATAQVGTVAHLARRVQRRRRLVALAGVAAVVAAAAGGAVLTAVVPTVPAAAETRLAPVGHSAVSAELTATAVPWGTRLAWACSYPEGTGGRYGATAYALVVTTDEGRTETVATWRAHGDGASGLSAATDIARGDIRTVEIRTEAGAVLARAALAG